MQNRHGASAINFIDIDSDGDLDLFWGDYFHRSLYVIYNIGDYQIRDDLEFMLIKYAEEKMFQFRDKAISLLNEIPDSPAKSSFQQLIDYSINRDK